MAITRPLSDLSLAELRKALKATIEASGAGSTSANALRWAIASKRSASDVVQVDTACGGCRYFSGGSSYLGVCRRYAPRPVVHLPDTGIACIEPVWPQVDFNDWCGEWKAKG